MQSHYIGPSNWTYTHYSNQDLKALVTVGAYLQDNEVKEEFFATIIDEDGRDIFQKSFVDLDEACHYLNKRFQKIWKFTDATRPSNGKEGGCATCVAH